MAKSDLLPDRGGASEISSPEVEFALVLTRIIDTAKNDPEELRRAIYDLARHKLQEQLASSAETDPVRTQQALETAIQGVEAFAVKHGASSFAPAPVLQKLDSNLPHVAQIEDRLQQRLGASAFRPLSSKPKTSRFAHLRWALVAMILSVAVCTALYQRERIQKAWANRGENVAVARNDPPQPAAPAQSNVASTAVQTPALAAAPTDPLIPKSFGVYAVSDGKLVELQPLPGRAPDMRVAVSAAIQSKPQSTLTTITPRFVVFRRDSGASVADNPEIRIVARIGRDFSGEPKNTSEGDTVWVMRNISIPFRASPIDGKPEMYAVSRGEDQNGLSPGRYALVLKGQVYDFNIAGKPTDPRHCLERVSSANGVFYSECRSP